MDYHSIGFRECASEVARYLVANEGMDLQDPMRLRTMSHLQCYAAQRELALKSSAHASVWNPSAFTTPSQFPSSTMSSLSSHASASIQPSTSSEPSLHSAGYASHLTSLDGNSLQTAHSMMPPPPPLFTPKANSYAKLEQADSSSQMPITSSHYPAAAGMSMGGHQMSASSHQYFSGYGHPSTTTGQHQGGSVKHYRPWGAELAY